ncbi:hypothetical protein SLS55_007002 [Diplodia seriata]|uniref:Chromosome segregation atpase family protein n=1 Tax=Diplodia seriata TaxID=420778 RepID=A0ABR3CC33_9PEZI
MPSSRRESSVEPDALVRHQHSFSSDSSRMSNIPMWDSSDPERAPPPLPLNPGSPLLTRPNTSATIANAAKALEEKARENAPNYTTNPMPERSLIKGAAHKRIQSFQDANLRDFRSILSPNRSPEKSPERPGSRHGASSAVPEPLSSPPASPEKTPSRTPTPAQRELMRDTPPLRTGNRSSHHKAILGENTPPSATYMALQSMPLRDFESPLHDASNGATPRARPQDADVISSQIKEIAVIASGLQREMAQLSRRSKDNATDLISLKEATNARDEDIRKSLKELVGNINGSAMFAPPPPIPGLHTRSNSFGGMSGVPGTPDTSDKHGFRLPRMNSSFLDERLGSPNPYSIEGAASVAMLEKIVREMVTKEGQERLVNTLNNLFEKSNQESNETSKKVGELVEFIKQGSESRALALMDVPSERYRASSPESQVTRATRDINAALGLANDANTSKPYSSPKAADFVSADMLKLLKKIKDSVQESGGITSETKALVRDLRGEVLGMGRELGRKIDEITPNSSGALALEDGTDKEDISRIVQEGLAELKEHMDFVMRSRRRGSGASMDSSVDNQEVYAVVKHALAEQGINQAAQPPGQQLDKDAILEAVKEAYEAYKPEIELQQFGLERDEILECLREGLTQYRSSAPAPESISRDDMMDAVMEALTHVEFPNPPSNTHEIREEVLSAVRECLDEIRPSMQVAAPSNHPDPELTRGIILEAVRDGFETHGGAAARELEISRDDLFDAVKAGLDTAPRELEISREDLFEAIKAGLQDTQTPLGGYGEQVMNRLQGLVEDMRTEFKAYSSANGRDTEQVLDALKDGLESLRAEIESYVDRAQDVTGKDEIIDSLRGGLDTLRSDVQGYVAAGPQGDQAINRSEMLDYIRSEFEHLHETLTSQIVPTASGDKTELLHTLNEGFDGLKMYMQKRDEEDTIKEEMEEAMKVEFDQLREAVIHGSASHRDEVLDTIHASLENLHVKLESRDEAAGATHSSEEVVKTMKEEFEHLREILATTLVKSGASDSKDDIIDAVRENMDALRDQLMLDQGDSSKETLGAIKEELDRLQETIGGSLVKSGGAPEDKEEILEALRVGLEGVKEVQSQNAGHGLSEEALQALCEQLENLRKSLLGNVASRADTEEILETVRLGLDDLCSDLSKKIDNPERQMAATGEILDAINDGVESLRTDIKTATGAGAAIDMSVNYEILETLKEGILTISTEITRLKGDKQATVEDDISAVGNEVVLAEDPDNALSRDAPAEAETEMGLKRDDLKELEVLMTQLQMKVEAMDSNIQNIPAPAPPNEAAPGVAMKEDLDSVAQKDDLAGIALKEDLVNVEELLKDVQAAVTVLSEDKRRDSEIVEGLARKEDTDAIETLLQNAKAQLDEIVLPDPETAVKKEHLDVVEAAVLVTNEAIDKLAAKIDGEDVASKGDVAVVEVLVQDLKTALDELKNAKPSEEEEAKKVTREDTDALGVLITEIKEKLAILPEPEAVPSKADIEQVVGLIHDFRDSHDKMKESYESDIGVTAKAFDDRKNEAEAIMTKVGEVKEFLDAVKEEIKAKLQEGGEGVDGVKETLKTLEETISNNFSITADVKELMETVNREFERTNGSIEGLKTDSEEKATAAHEKHDAVKDAVIAGLVEKLDEKFTEMTSKYDDLLLLAEASAQKMDDKTTAQEELMTSTKTISEELKVTMDTLGTTITGMNTAFTETTDKLTGDSATVFTKIDDATAKLDKIDDATAKLDEKHEDNKVEHQMTRDEVAKAITALTVMQDDLTENHPKFMMSLQEVLALVTQHYEQSKATEEAAKAAQEESKAAVEAAAAEARSRAEELKESFFSGLPALLPPPPEPTEKYDDSPVKEKLDQLLGHAADAEKSAAQLERLDEIHQQVVATAAEVTEFVQFQTKLITEGHENKEKEAEEAAILLERRLVQKENIENDILNLNDEKDTLRQQVETLRHEKEMLTNQKMRLHADVSALEMALNIRREELQNMEHKADSLERRILNGIMDHSRALLLQKGVKAPRVSRAPSNASPDASSMATPSAMAKGVNMALGARAAAKRNAAAQANPQSRRILSLSQISGNTPTGAQSFAGAPNTGLKRSHSVKTNYGYQKPSWGSKRTVSDANKENDILGEESEEEELDDMSDAGTERHHSIVSGHGSDAEFASTYDDRGSEAGSEYTYGTGSYLTGTASQAGRRTSIGTMGNGTATVHEGDISDEEDGESQYSDAPAAEEDEGEATEIPRYAESVSGSSVASGSVSEAPAAGEGPTASEVSATTEAPTASEVSTVTEAPTESEVSTVTEAPTGATETPTASEIPTEIDEQPQSDVVSDAGTKDVEPPTTEIDAAPPTPSELKEAEIALPPLEPPATKEIFGPGTPNDSALGSDIPTAQLEAIEGADYFRRVAEEEASMVSSALQ